MRDGRKAPACIAGAFCCGPMAPQFGSESKRPAEEGASLDLQVLSRVLTAIVHEFILNSLALIQSAQAGTFDRRDVDEHILASTLRLNESIALGWIEPFHVPSRHRRLRSSSKRTRTLLCEPGKINA